MTLRRYRFCAFGCGRFVRTPGEACCSYCRGAAAPGGAFARLPPDEADARERRILAHQERIQKELARLRGRHLSAGLPESGYLDG
jgi:hypothetical protein